jgi:hypothetical protein
MKLHPFSTLILAVIAWTGVSLLYGSYYTGKIASITSGTPVQLTSASPVPPSNCVSITVQALTSNAGTIYVGASNVSASSKIGMALAASVAAYFAPAGNASQQIPESIWVDTTNTGDGVSYSCVK